MSYGAAVTTYASDNAGNIILKGACRVERGCVYGGENRMTKLMTSDGNDYLGEIR